MQGLQSLEDVKFHSSKPDQDNLIADVRLVPFCLQGVVPKKFAGHLHSIRVPQAYSNLSWSYRPFSRDCTIEATHLLTRV